MLMFLALMNLSLRVDFLAECANAVQATATQKHSDAEGIEDDKAEDDVSHLSLLGAQPEQRVIKIIKSINLAGWGWITRQANQASVAKQRALV